MKDQLNQWLGAVRSQAGGDILAIQTLRNALMASGVLASAAMVALMGVLATAHLHPSRWPSALSAALLVASAWSSMGPLWAISTLGFQLQFSSDELKVAAVRLDKALQRIRWSAVSLVAGLACAAASVWLAKA